MFKTNRRRRRGEFNKSNGSRRRFGIVFLLPSDLEY